MACAMLPDVQQSKLVPDMIVTGAVAVAMYGDVAALLAGFDASPFERR